MIVYDITSRESFEIVQDWITDVCSYCPSGVKLMIVGNKIDLEMENREVSYEEGKQYANERGYEFFETSAKLGVKVESAFRGLVQTILQTRNFNTEVVSSSEPQIRLQRNETKEENIEEQNNGGCC